MEPTAMDAEVILRELTYAERLPREALKAASAQRDEMLPLFLNEIETYLARGPASRPEPTPLFFIFHLLGEWREKTAYRPLARLLRLPEHEIDTIFGDGITSTTHRVMAAVCDGDPEPLSEVFLDPHAEQFIRSRMCEALAMVTLRGELDRALASRILRDAFMEMQPQAQNFVWFGWQSAIAMLGFSDLKTLVKRAFDRAFIDSYVLEFDHFEQDLRRGIERFGEPPDDHEYTLVGDTIDELSHWYCFSDQYSEDQEQRRRQAEVNCVGSEPLQNPFKGIGRNDPCPCGSGKKFKRCCLATVRLGLLNPMTALLDKRDDSFIH
jgi:hypothetical protein